MVVGELGRAGGQGRAGEGGVVIDGTFESELNAGEVVGLAEGARCKVASESPVESKSDVWEWARDGLEALSEGEGRRLMGDDISTDRSSGLEAATKSRDDEEDEKMEVTYREHEDEVSHGDRSGLA